MLVHDRGKKRKLTISREVICEACSGSGSTKAGAVAECSTCHGSKREMVCAIVLFTHLNSSQNSQVLCLNAFDLIFTVCNEHV